MDDNLAIEAEHISKKFCRYLRRSMLYGMQDIGRNMLGIGTRSEMLRKDEFWAVDDVSFTLQKGGALGIIGPNGSGKSTMLKMLNGIFMPDAGRIEINGEVGALIEIGAGFHPMLTGRENIYINAAILGMTRKETEEKINDIIDFSGVRSFIDMPVKYYSSGMYVRLGFSVAIHCNPDVLLIDEILSVGDAAFQEKCLRRISDVKRDTTIAFVSHSLYQIEALCDSVLWLEKGKVQGYGKAGDIIRQYLDSQEKLAMAEVDSKRHESYTGTVIGASRSYLDSVDKQAREAQTPSPDRLLDITGVDVLDGSGNKTNELPFFSGATFRVHYNALRRIEGPLFTLRVLYEGKGVFEASMLVDGNAPEVIEGRGHIDCRFEDLPLTPKVYEVLVFVRSSDGIADITPMKVQAKFRVIDENMEERTGFKGIMRHNLLRQPRGVRGTGGCPVLLKYHWSFPTAGIKRKRRQENV